MPEVFLTFMQNKIRNWIVSIPTKVKSLDQIFDPTIANLILDSIYYNVHLFQIERRSGSSGWYWRRRWVDIQFSLLR